MFGGTLAFGKTLRPKCCRRLHCLFCFKIEAKKGEPINWTNVQRFSTGTSTTSIGTHLVSHNLIKKASRQVNDQRMNKVLAESSSKVIHKNLGRQALMMLLALFIVCCNLPFKIIENRHFKRFINALDPNFKIPNTRSTISQVYLPKVYLHVYEKVKLLFIKSSYDVMAYVLIYGTAKETDSNCTRKNAYCFLGYSEMKTTKSLYCI